MKLLLILLITVSSSIAAFPQSTLPDSDFQVWNETTLAFPVIKSKDKNGKTVDQLSLLLFGVLRLGQNRLYPVDKRIGVGFDARINGNFSFSPTYLYRAGQPFRNRNEYEHRLRFDVSYDKKWKKFSIKDRARIEYRFRNSRQDTVRFRNKFTLRVPVNKDGKELFAPFVAEESFYDFQAKTWSSNEFSIGISKKLTSSLSSEFFYLLRNNRTGLKTINVVGVNLKFRID